jgi:hypothetical protein
VGDTQGNESITLDGVEGRLTAPNVMVGAEGKPVILLLGNGQIVCQYLSCGGTIGLDSNSGQIRLWHAGQDVIVLDGPSGKVKSPMVIVGGENKLPGLIQVCNEDNSRAIEINGGDQSISCSDILLFNADCAEEFDLQECRSIDAGSVVILTDEGAVAECREEYDTRVAGVISGAGTYRPGLLLDRQNTNAGRVPVALMGKAFCKVDATKAPIHAGDLLVSSPLAGHAMKARDRSRLPGCVIGKALAPMPEGTGLLPMLLVLS